MKDICTFISEKYLIDKSFKEEPFIDVVTKMVEKTGCVVEISKVRCYDILKIRNERLSDSFAHVTILFNNSGEKYNGSFVPMYTSSLFVDEKCIIRIQDWHDHYDDDLSKKNKMCKLSKELFDNLFNDGLEEATHGRNSQFNTWKFAIKTAEEENIALKHLEEYCKKLRELYF